MAIPLKGQEVEAQMGFSVILSGAKNLRLFSAVLIIRKPKVRDVSLRST